VGLGCRDWCWKCWLVNRRMVLIGSGVGSGIDHRVGVIEFQ
jgi:hypothetical protein